MCATLLTTDNFVHFSIQSFRLEFSTHGGCYDFLVRDKDRCEKFLGLFVGKLFSFSFFSVIFFFFVISVLHHSAPYRAGYAFVIQFFAYCSVILTLADIAQKAQSKAGSRPAVVTPPHPQTLQHIR